MTVPDTTEEIRKEARRVEEDSSLTAKSHFSTASLWRAGYWVLGLSATVAAVTATQIAAAGVVAAVCVAVSTFLNPSAQHKEHLRAGNAFLGLSRDARRFVNIRLRVSSTGDAADQLDLLAKRYESATLAAPQPSGLGYRIARRGIKTGEASYAVDSENLTT